MRSSVPIILPFIARAKQSARGATKWQYSHGYRQVEAISPNNWIIDQALLDRPGNKEIQVAMFYDYRTNVPLYPQWQEYFRKHQPPTLIVWGKTTPSSPKKGHIRTSATSRNWSFTCWIRVILPWKRTAT